jgi:hypothetical protein
MHGSHFYFFSSESIFAPQFGFAALLRATLI